MMFLAAFLGSLLGTAAVAGVGGYFAWKKLKPMLSVGSLFGGIMGALRPPLPPGATTLFDGAGLEPNPVPEDSQPQPEGDPPMSTTEIPQAPPEIATLQIVCPDGVVRNPGIFAKSAIEGLLNHFRGGYHFGQAFDDVLGPTGEKCPRGEHTTREAIPVEEKPATVLIPTGPVPVPPADAPTQ